MIKYVLAASMLLAASAQAKPAYTDCIAQDGGRFYMAASSGTVAVKWGDDGDWGQAFGKVDGPMVTVTQMGKHGVIVIAWNTNTDAAYIVIKDDRNGKRTEFRARCWFK